MKLKEANEVVLFCDMHAHSKKRNVFMYGCSSNKTDKTNKLIAMLTPVFMTKSNANFSFKNSHFRMEKQKESTARIVMFRQMGILNSYTIECSFYGSESSENQYFGLNDLNKIGKDLAKSCLMFINPTSIHRNLYLTAVWLQEYKESKRGKIIDELENDNKKDLEFFDGSFNPNDVNCFASGKETDYNFEKQRADTLIQNLEDTDTIISANRLISTAVLNDEIPIDLLKNSLLNENISKSRRSSQLFHTKYILFTPNLIPRSKTQSLTKGNYNCSKRASFASLNKKLTSYDVSRTSSSSTIPQSLTPLKGRKLGFELTPIIENRLKNQSSNVDLKESKPEGILHKGLHSTNPVNTKNYIKPIKNHKRFNSDNVKKSMKDLAKLLITSKLAII